MNPIPMPIISRIPSRLGTLSTVDILTSRHFLKIPSSKFLVSFSCCALCESYLLMATGQNEYKQTNVEYVRKINKFAECESAMCMDTGN